MSGSSRSASCPRTRAGWSPRSWSALRPLGRVRLHRPARGPARRRGRRRAASGRTCCASSGRRSRRRLAEVGEQRQREVIDALDHALGPLLFTPATAAPTRALARAAARARLGLKLSKFGPFIGCSNYPDCRYTRAFTSAATSGRRRGGEPTGCWARPGRRRGGRGSRSAASAPTCSAAAGPRPSAARCRRASAPDEVDLETGAAPARPAARGRPPIPRPASRSWPGIGRYGPFVQLGKQVRAPASAGDDVLTIGMNRALDLLAEPAEGRGAPRRRRQPLRELGRHPRTASRSSSCRAGSAPTSSTARSTPACPRRMTPDA